MNKEFFNSNEFNNFQEYQKFSAEEYRLPSEHSKMGPEYTPTPEQNSPEKPPLKKHNDTNIADKLKDKLAQTTTHATTHMTAGLATTALTGTVAAVTVFTPIGAPNPNIKINELVTGENSVYYSIFADDLDLDYKYSIEIKNSQHKFTFPLIEGLNENVVNGLLPGYEYTITMVGKSDNNVTVEYKKQKFYTLKEKLPDINYNLTKRPKQTYGYGIDYTIDISDKKDEFDSFFVNITNGNNLLQKTDAVNGKISGYLDQLPCGIINFSVFGTIQDKQIFISEKEYFVETPSYSITLGENYTFDKDGRIQIPYTIVANEMADQIIGKIEFSLQFDNGIPFAPEDVYNVNANEENTFTLSEPPAGATSVIITPKLYITGGVDGVPVEYLAPVEFNLPYNLELVSTSVFLNKINPSEKTLSLVFGMHDNPSTRLFINDGSGTPQEVFGGKFDMNIDTPQNELNLSYYKQYEDGTTSAEIPITVSLIPIPDYTFNYVSQLNEVFYTYNNDGTYNAYFDMRNAGAPALSNPNLYYNIVLTDSSGAIQTYSFKDDIAVIKNLFDNYSIEYQVCQKIDNVTYTYQKTPVSGSIQASARADYIDGMLMQNSMDNGQELNLTLNTDHCLYEFSDVQVNTSDGKITRLTKDDFYINELGDYKLILPLSNDITYATIFINICDNKLNYQKFNDLGLIVGSPYTTVRKTFNAAP